MWEILNNYQGIIGIVIGVFLGWFLSLLNLMGKVTFYKDKIKVEYFEKDSAGGIYKKDLNEKTIYGIFSFDLDIINTSSRNRMLRNIHCLLSISNEKVIKEINDVETRRIVAAKPDYDNFEIINIPPKNIIKKKLSIHLSKDDLLKIDTGKSRINFKFNRLWGLKRKKIINISHLLNGKIV